jgi:hypothetical protein
MDIAYHLQFTHYARMAESADALIQGSGGRKIVQVQVLFLAPREKPAHAGFLFRVCK